MSVTTEVTQRVDAANRQALDRFLAARPALVDVVPLSEFDPRQVGRILTHAGPPLTPDPDRMPGVIRGAVMATALHQGWVSDPADALELVAAEDIQLVANHDRGGVGGVAGVIAPSMMVYVVQDRVSGTRTYSCHEYQSFFGRYDGDALAELHAWDTVHMPAIGRAVAAVGGVDLLPIEAEAVRRGDELHCLPAAASARLALTLASALARDGAFDTLELLAADELTFLPLAMAGAKAALLAAEGVEGSSMVTVMARNGVEFGIKVSGLGDEWFTGEASEVETLFFDEYGPQDAGRDCGDSVIVETGGLGGNLLVAAPTMVDLIGHSLHEFLDISLAMRQITIGLDPRLPIPQLGGEGPALGIDVLKVAETGQVPYVTTATSHREEGHPMIGLGIARPSLRPFKLAAAAWRERYEDR